MKKKKKKHSSLAFCLSPRCRPGLCCPLPSFHSHTSWRVRTLSVRRDRTAPLFGRGRRFISAHWDVLLRARAIETGSYVIAPAQSGLHEDGRKTWGHSMIIGPWGEVVAVRKDAEPGVLSARIDLDKVAEARRRIPALEHDRDLAGPDMPSPT